MEATEALIQQLESPLNNTLTTPVIYQVKSGDTLSKIITQYYDVNYADPRYKTALASVLHFNKSVKDPNEIHAGQLLRLMPLFEDNSNAFCPVPDDFHQGMQGAVATRHRLEPVGDYQSRFRHHLPLSLDEQEAFWALAWLEENYGVAGTIALGAGLNTWGGLVSQPHNAFIAEVKVLWNQYQRGALTQNQYDYRRQLALKKYAQHIGPFEKILFKGKTAREAVRISRSKVIPATSKIDRQLHRLRRMARYAKHGGIILTAAGVGMACHDIGNARTIQKKNEIFVEALAGSAASVISGVGLTLLFASNPAGWIVALSLGMVSAYGSHRVGKEAGKFYNRHGQHIDFVSISGADNICK